MRILVDRELCEGNARCVRVAPAVFEVGDDDQVRILVEPIGEDQREAVETAAAVCPRQALKLVD